MIEWASLVILPLAGWLANKQLDVNQQVAENTSAIKSLTDNSNHTRDRVDAIYDHLITQAGSRKGRGSEE